MAPYAVEVVTLEDNLHLHLLSIGLPTMLSLALATVIPDP